jgi:hypothetical protein
MAQVAVQAVVTVMAVVVVAAAAATAAVVAAVVGVVVAALGRRRVDQAPFDQPCRWRRWMASPTAVGMCRGHGGGGWHHLQRWGCVEDMEEVDGITYSGGDV